MPHLKSPYLDLPMVPDRLNVYETIIGRPEQDDWTDFTVHVEDASGKKTTFKELRKKINDLATALGTPRSQGGLGLGTEGGEMIGIMSENSSGYVVLVLALLKVATPFVLISCYSTPFELRHALALAKVTRIFAAPQYFSTILPVAKEVGVVKERIYAMNSQVEGYKSLEELIRDTSTKRLPETQVRIVSKDSLAYLVFSSGTSGLPKAVMASQGNVLFALRQAAALQRYRSEAIPSTKWLPGGLPVSLAFLPMHHVHGLHAYCFRSFITPTQFIILPRWDAERVLKAIPEYRVTSLSLVPSLIYQLVSHPSISRTDLSSVLSVHSGAAYLPRELLTKLLAHTRRDVHFTEGYGLSETTVSAIALPLPGTLGRRFTGNRNATGILLPGMEARIVRDDGTEANYDEVGELWLKGPNIVPGYWNNATATEESFVDGWLRTGDKFKVDDDQYFYFTERSKDILKVSGVQVSPTEIEDVLLAHPHKLVSDVTVAGVPGGRTADEKVPRAWIVLSENGERLGASKVIQELEKWHRMNLSKYKWLRGGIEVVREIPKSPTGKTLRRVLQDLYEQDLKRIRAKL